MIEYILFLIASPAIVIGLLVLILIAILAPKFVRFIIGAVVIIWLLGNTVDFNKYRWGIPEQSDASQPTKLVSESAVPQQSELDSTLRRLRALQTSKTNKPNEQVIRLSNGECAHNQTLAITLGLIAYCAEVAIHLAIESSLDDPHYKEKRYEMDYWSGLLQSKWTGEPNYYENPIAK